MIIPRYLDHLKAETAKRDNSIAAKAEVASITSLAVAIRALVACCESFARYLPLKYACHCELSFHCAKTKGF